MTYCRCYTNGIFLFLVLFVCFVSFCLIFCFVLFFLLSHLSIFGVNLQHTVFLFGKLYPVVFKIYCSSIIVIIIIIIITVIILFFFIV